MRALHVIGVDFELGLGVGGGAAREEHGFDRLFAIGQLGVPRNGDLAEIRAGGGAAEHVADDLARGAADPDVANGGDYFERRGTSADDRRVEFEMRAVVERDIEFVAAIARRGIERVNMRRGSGGECDFGTANLDVIAVRKPDLL